MKCTRLGFLKSLCTIPVGLGLTKAAQAAAPMVKVVEVKRFSGVKTPPVPSPAEFEATMRKMSEAFNPFLEAERTRLFDTHYDWACQADPEPLTFKAKDKS